MCTHGYFSPNQQLPGVEMALPLCKQRLHYIQPFLLKEQRWASSALEMLSTPTDVFLKKQVLSKLLYHMGYQVQWTD